MRSRIRINPAGEIVPAPVSKYGSGPRPKDPRVGYFNTPRVVVTPEKRKPKQGEKL